MRVHGLDAEAIGTLAAERGIALFELTPLEGSLEDAFLELTGDEDELPLMGLVRSELSKLASARSTWWMLGIGLVIEGLYAGLLAGLPADELNDPADTGQFLLTGSGVLFLLNLVLGSMPEREYRHRTANWTLTAEPRCWRVIMSKATVAALVGLAAGLATVAVNAALRATRPALPRGARLRRPRRGALTASRGRRRGKWSMAGSAGLGAGRN